MQPKNVEILYRKTSSFINLVILSELIRLRHYIFFVL